MNNEPITSKELEEKMKSEKNVLILDVRDKEKYQFRTFSAEGIEAQNIPYIEMKESGSEVTQALTSLPKDTEIITVCTTGNKAQKAAELLQEQGFSARSLEGGLTAWWAYTSDSK